MEPASSRPDVGNDLPCGFCPSRRAPYTCPRCLLRFCSVPCYHNHGSCARDFQDRELRLRLQGLRGDEASRGRVREALWRLRELREPGDEQAQVGLGPEEEQLWEELTLEEQKAFRKLLSSGEAASLVPLWTPWWETAAPCALIQEVDPQNPPKAGERDLIEERDPQKPLQGVLVEEVDPQKHSEAKDWDLIEETDLQKPLERRKCDLIEESDLQKHLECDLIDERDPQKSLESKVCAFVEERDPQKHIDGKDCDLIEKMDLWKPLRGAYIDKTDAQKPLGGKPAFMEETGPQNQSEAEECAFIDERDPQKSLQIEGDLTEQMDPQKPSQAPFIGEVDPRDPLEADKYDRSKETDPQKPSQREKCVFIDKMDPQKPLRGSFVEERDPQKPLRGVLIEEMDPKKPLQCTFVEERDPQKPLVEERDPQESLQGAFIEKTNPQNPLEAEEHDLIGERDPQNPLQGGEDLPKCPRKPLCETEASHLLCSIPPVIPPLSSFRISVSPSIGFQLPNILFGYVYSLSLYNGDVEEEEVLLEFCETLLDVSSSLGSSQRVYGSVSEALQDALRSITDQHYPECPLGRNGAMAAVAKLLSHKAFLLAALCHLCKLLRKGKKLMADSDRSKAFRAGKKCAFLLSWANENEGQLPFLALAVQEEGRTQRAVGQEVGALRRGLERKWRGKRPPMEEKKEKKALIEELV